MKTFLAIFLLFLAGRCVKSHPEMDKRTFMKFLVEKVQEIEEKCEEESGVNDDDLETLDEGKIPTTDAGRCMIACELREYGIIEDNKYNKNGFFELLPKYVREHKSLQNIRNLFERCESAVKKVPEGEFCELGAKLKLCFQQHASEFGVKSMPLYEDYSDSESDEYGSYKK